MWQLGAIVRYEVLMHWRRRGLVVVLVLLLILLIGFALFNSGEGQNLQTQVRAALISITDEVVINTSLIINILLLVMMVFCVAVTVMTAETVPIDHETRVKPLLDSLPLTRTTYLLGKLLGVWLMLALGLMVIAAFCGLALWQHFGAFDVLGYALVWLLAVLPLTLFAASLGTLLASTQSSRRRGIMLMTPFLLYPYTVVLFSFGTLVDGVVLLRPATVIRTFMMGLGASYDILQVFAFLGLNVAVLWLMAWSWQRWQEGRN
jgi:hypothetical protein